MNAGWGRGEGAWFVGLDFGTETIVVSDVLDNTGNTGSVSKGVLAGDNTLFVGVFLTTQFGAEFVFGIEGESEWSWGFTFDLGSDVLDWSDSLGDGDWLWSKGDDLLWGSNGVGNWLGLENTSNWLGLKNTSNWKSSGTTSAKLDDLLGASG